MLVLTNGNRSDLRRNFFLLAIVLFVVNSKTCAVVLAYECLTHRFPSRRQLRQKPGLFSPGASARGHSTRGIRSRGGITLHTRGHALVVKAASGSMLVRRHGSSLLWLHSVGVSGVMWVARLRRLGRMMRWWRMILLDSVGLNEVVTEGLEIHFKN